MPRADAQGQLSRDVSPLGDARVRAALTRAEAYPHDPRAGRIEEIQTHLSHVFLSGERVYKFRKPVALGFVDFTTRAERDADCLREVALNRRLAPDVYLGVAPLELGRGAVRVGAPGETLAPAAAEHCVVMRRLSAGRDALSLLERGALRAEQLDRVARRIARFHDAHGLGTPAPYGEAEWLAHCTDPARANFDALRRFARTPDERAAMARLEQATLGFARDHAARFEARRRAGRAVDAHGDLHLQHVWFEHDDAEPLAIDCLEFDPELRRIDAASEVAFLAMDLRYRGAHALAERFLRIYAAERDDFDLYRVVDWFESYRAAVRAKVAALAAGAAEIDAAQRERAQGSAARHLELATAALAPERAPALVLVGGAVGTGKTTVAAALADRLDAVVVASDRVRKRRLGLAAGERAPASAYDETAKAEVYAALIERAGAVIASGRIAILDASWGARRQRDAARAFAASQQVPACFVETTCEPALAEARLAERARAGRDASDAGPELHAASRAGFEPLAEWSAGLCSRVATDTSHWSDMVDDVARRIRTTARLRA